MASSPETNLRRRGFLRGLIAAPFVARLGVLMPVKPTIILPAFLPGDLVGSAAAFFRGTHGFIGARMVERVEGGTAYLWNNCYGPSRRAEPVPVEAVTLFHGLPGNRVNNPSMRHRLAREPGGLALAYPEDLRRA